MFEKFLKHVNWEGENSFASEEAFREKLGGESFLNGMYRLFRKDQLEKWTGIVEEAFPAHRGGIEVFGYDWFGQIYAVDKKTKMVVWFQPGTGDVLDIPADFVSFHEEEIVANPEDALVSRYFEYWFENSGRRILKHNECVGYKVPLYLNGVDDLENLEVSDMEVYWGIMSPLMNL